jgi:hypothetical protein
MMVVGRFWLFEGLGFCDVIGCGCCGFVFYGDGFSFVVGFLRYVVMLLLRFEGLLFWSCGCDKRFLTLSNLNHGFTFAQ